MVGEYINGGMRLRRHQWWAQMQRETNKSSTENLYWHDNLWTLL